MLNLKLFIGLSTYIIFIYAGFIKDKLFNGTIIRIERLNNQCRSKNNVPCHGYFQGVKTISTSIFVGNYTLVVKEDGYKNLMLTITIDRCQTQENLDTCEEHFKQPNIDICRAIDTNNRITNKSQIAFPLLPPIKCPIKKGTYHAYNFTYDLAPFIFFELDGWYWKVTGEVFAPERNKVIYCIHSEAHITNSKFKRN